MREETGDAKQRWRETVLTRALAAHPDRRPAAATSSGIPVDLLYDPSDLGRFSYPDRLGYPGDYPYTRGVQATMYRSRPWTMRQYAGFGTAEESNRRFRYLLSQGQTGLSIAFDLRRRSATTATTRSPRARSGGSASRWIQSRRWSSSSGISPSTGSAPR